MGTISKKMSFISEKVVLPLFFLIYISHTISNIGFDRLSLEYDKWALFILILLLVFYAISTSLTRLANILLIIWAVLLSGTIISLSTHMVIYHFSFISLILIFFICVATAIKSFIEINNNDYLMWLLTFTCIIVNIYLFTLYYILRNIDTSELSFPFILLSIASFAMIFGIPNSNFPEWKLDHQKIFIKMILIVFLLLFTLTMILAFVPVKPSRSILLPENYEKWGMVDY